MGTLSNRTAAPLPRPGCVVYCRSHNHLVEEVWPPEEECRDTVVRLACLDDDANGQITEVFWEREVDARNLGQSTWETIGQRGFDDPRVFSSYLHTLQWNCVTATDPGLFQSPLRAGIDVKPYQLEPLRKALRMPRVALFIADDVGLGKTIEAGLIMRELLLRQKVQRVVVVAPPSVVLQWQGGSKIAIDSKLTNAIRGLSPRFEHKLFLSATPHNGHSNSFSALLEILDPTRFCRGDRHP